MSSDHVITKSNLDEYFSTLAKEFHKKYRTALAEIILIGGASALLCYDFRDSTMDIDAIIQASADMKGVINRVGDMLDLETGWLNSDFMKTTSYTPKLIQYSRFYKTFSHCLTIRVVRGEYLVAMKLVSARKYKHDISDIAGIIDGEKRQGNILDFEKIDKAMINLYGSWDRVPERQREILNKVLQADDVKKVYEDYQNNEEEVRRQLREFSEQYPNVIRRETINEIVEQLQKKKQRDTKT